MDSTWYQMLLIFLFLHHCQSKNVQTNVTTDIVNSEEQYGTTQETQNTSEERSTKSLTNGENNLISDDISPLLLYHERFQTKDKDQNLQLLTAALGINNLKSNSSGRVGKIPDHIHTPPFSNNDFKVNNIPKQPTVSNALPSYSAPPLKSPSTEDYHQIQQQFAYKPSNSSSHSQVPTFDQNAAYNQYLNQLSLFHILNNYQQNKQSTTPVPPTTTLAIQVTSKPTPPPIDKNDYSNIAYIPAIHGTQLQGLFGASPPSPVGPPAPPPGPGLFAITSPEDGNGNVVLPPGVPDPEITPENAVLNTPGVTSTTIANCLTGKLCSFILASVIAAGTTGALALPVAWPYLGAFFGRKKRDTVFESSKSEFLNDHNIPSWVIEWYKQMNHSEILDKDFLATILDTNGKITESSIQQHLNFEDIFNTPENLNEYLGTMKENKFSIMDENNFSSENNIYEQSYIFHRDLPATLSTPPKKNYQTKHSHKKYTMKNLKNDNANSNDNKNYIPHLETRYLIRKICSAFDKNKVPKNKFSKYIMNQCSKFVQNRFI